MPILKLCFGTSVLKEFSLGSEPVSIGRSPQASIFIDNPAVSHQHAKIFFYNENYYVEDLGSLNGTFLNGMRITQQALLRRGDTIAVGKHTIQFVLEPPGGKVAGAPLAPSVPAQAQVPKLDGTMILDVKSRRELHEKFAPAAGAEQVREVKRVGKLIVLSGRTTQKELLLSSQVSLIGKSQGAALQLKGWFAPAIAGIISKQGDSYFLTATGKKARVNGQPLTGRCELKDGDLLALGRVHLQFRLVAW